VNAILAIRAGGRDWDLTWRGDGWVECRSRVGGRLVVADERETYALVKLIGFLRWAGG